MAVPLMVAATVVSTIGAIQSAHAQRQAADYNAQMAQMNAGVAQQQGRAAQLAQQQDSERRLGQMRALYGAAGVSGDSGSPLDVLTSSVRQASLDNMTVGYNAQLRGLGYQSQANLYSSQASNASTAGFFSATGTALGGASRAYYYSGGGSPKINTYNQSASNGYAGNVDT